MQDYEKQETAVSGKQNETGQPERESEAITAESTAAPADTTFKAQRKPFFTASKIAKIAILSAFAYVLYAYVRFPLPPFPGFLDFKVSDIPVLLGGFLLGPIEGCIIVVFQVGLKFLFNGSSTMGVGDLSDLVTGVILVLVSSLIYRRHRNLKGAILALVCGSLAMTFVAILSNIFVLVPLFVELFFKGDFNKLVTLCAGMLPFINEDNFFTWYSLLIILPFNLIRCIVSSVVTFLLYKRLSYLFKKF